MFVFKNCIDLILKLYPRIRNVSFLIYTIKDLSKNQGFQGVLV